MEKSKSGSVIHRYNDRSPTAFQTVSGMSSTVEISAHIETHIGTIDSVFHEIISDTVHIDIHWVKPTDEKPFHTLITSGMSDLPMNTPAGVQGSDYAELSICLPDDWKISEEDFKEEKNYWPFRWLKHLARFPHENNSWLGWGHTIPNGEPAKAFADNTKLNTLLLLPTVIFDSEFSVLKLKNKTIDFFSLFPLYGEELDLKIKKGVEALNKTLIKSKLTDVLDIHRPSMIKKRKRFGLF